MYPYPYYANVSTPMYHPGYMANYRQESNPEVTEAVLSGVKREASAIDLYNRLARLAPNHQHKNAILQGLENKKVQVNQLTNLYSLLTGQQPVYHISKTPINSYRGGLQKAYEAEIEGYQEYQKSYLLTQLPQVRNAFLWALTGEQENAARFSYLKEDYSSRITDYGAEPFVVDIEKVTTQNNTFRTALWTGDHLQLTLMSIGVGESIGLEIHPDLDQFLRIEEGEGLVQMGDSKDRLDFQQKAFADYAIVIPAGKWHNLINTGNKPIKLYSIYAPPQHPYGTIHETKAIAMAAEENHH